MLTERMQKRILYHLFSSPGFREHDTSDLEGIDPDPFDFSEPWRSIFFMAERSDGLIQGISALSEAAREVAEDDEDRRRIMNEIEAAAAPLDIQNADDMELGLDDITWVWEDWIPRGFLSLVGGYPGTGKSFFLMDLVRSITKGDQWPDGTPVGLKGNVIYVDAEGVPQINAERKSMLGVDGQRLFFILPEDGRVLDFNHAYWKDKLRDTAEFLKPELIVIDSLSSITLKGINSQEEVQPLMSYLVSLSMDFNCGVVLVHHLRKPPNNQLSLFGVSIHDFRGSQNILAHTRTAFGISVVQTNGQAFTLNGERRIDMVKTNFRNWVDPLGITSETEGDQMKFIYTEAPDFERDATKQSDCGEWLIGYLEKNGPSKPSAAIKAGRKELGVSKNTIRRAREDLADMIVNTEESKHSPINKWALADNGSQDEE